MEQRSASFGPAAARSSCVRSRAGRGRRADSRCSAGWASGSPRVCGGSSGGSRRRNSCRLWRGRRTLTLVTGISRLVPPPNHPGKVLTFSTHIWWYYLQSKSATSYVCEARRRRRRRAHRCRRTPSPNPHNPSLKRVLITSWYCLLSKSASWYQTVAVGRCEVDIQTDDVDNQARPAP